MSCGELERLFLAGASEDDMRRHRAECRFCRAIGADVDATEEISAALVAPALSMALRTALLDIPRTHVSCEGAERLLPMALENELTDGDDARLSRHLARCAACTEAAEALFATRDLLEPSPPPWLAQRLAAARPEKPQRRWKWLLDPKAAIGFAYAAAVVVMLLGFNPADLARSVRVGELGENTRAAVVVAESSFTDRIGALQEKAARTFAVWKGRAGGYGRAAVSNAVSRIWRSSTTKDRPTERPRNRDGRGAFRERETTITSWRA